MKPCATGTMQSPIALTGEFKDTVAARVQRDPRFREALFTEAMNAYLGGETSAGKAILRDLVNATIGFEELASVLKKPSKSLHRMLAIALVHLVSLVRLVGLPVRPTRQTR